MLSAKIKKGGTAVELNDRKKQILKMIIDAYIDSGEPVGSKYLTQHGGLSLSSATIRNEMSELEEMGYLDKPHTSAGRIPSSAGYRFYVDKLMEDYRLNLEELELLNDLTKFKTAETERLIERAGRIMSGITRYASVSLAAKPSCSTVSKFDAVLLGEKSFLLVMITGNGEVKTTVINTECRLAENDILRLKSVFNKYLVGVAPDSVQLETVFSIEEELGRLKGCVNPVLRAAYNASKGNDLGQVKVDGVTNLLEYPEFSDIDKVKSLMRTFEQRSGAIRELISHEESSHIPDATDTQLPEGLHPHGKEQSVDYGGIRIYIGDQSGDSVLSDTSIVYCSVPIGGTNAVIGVIGPRRMDYKKVVSSLRYFAEGLEGLTKAGNLMPPGLPKELTDGNGTDKNDN